MTLPPALRAFQQTYTYQVLKSALYGAVSSGAMAYFNHDPKGWLVVGGLAFLTTLQSGIEHSPNSASFHDDGTTNTAVTNVVNVQKTAAATPPGSDAHQIATNMAVQVKDAAALLGVKQ